MKVEGQGSFWNGSETQKNLQMKVWVEWLLATYLLFYQLCESQNNEYKG